MRKRAFTLIELMIVIAVMSIILSGVITPIHMMYGDYRRNDRELDLQLRITRLFMVMKALLLETTAIEEVTSCRVSLSGGRWKTIRREKEGRRIVLVGEKGERSFDVSGGLLFGQFKKIDSVTFGSPLKFEGGTSFPMYWRCGR
jgi:prepilin-type N-terminal cleavage/methylation domain-containing protein